MDTELTAAEKARYEALGDGPPPVCIDAIIACAAADRLCNRPPEHHHAESERT